MSNPANICPGCSSEVADQFEYTIKGTHWHRNCVRCCVCKKKLSKKCYEKHRKLYCKHHFFRTFGVNCSSCWRPILATDMVRNIHHEKIYHAACFICFRCGKILADGDDAYFVKTDLIDGGPFCYTDYMELRANVERHRPYQRIEGTLIGDTRERLQFNQSPHNAVCSHTTRSAETGATVSSRASTGDQQYAEAHNSPMKRRKGLLPEQCELSPGLTGRSTTENEITVENCRERKDQEIVQTRNDNL